MRLTGYQIAGPIRLVNATVSASSLAANAPWIVMKFGGTSVATVDRWQTILQLARSRREEGARVLLVVSALSGVTDKLKALCDMDTADARQAQARDIIGQHQALLSHMKLDTPASLEVHFARLRELAAGEPGGEALAWKAEVQSHGELMSSTLGAAFLSANGLATQWVDSRECLKAIALPNQNARTRMLSAMVDAHPDPHLSESLAARGEAFIAQGFIARDADGRTVLLGRGGSDTSAAYFGALLRAGRVETWTDVAGMFSANPRQVPGARLLKRLDYEEAQEIASTGAKVLHPRCLSPLREPRVPLSIKDTNRPELEGTVIGPRERDSAPSVKAISTRKGITLVSMESVGMWQQVGFLSDVFDAFKRHGLSVDLIGSAETNVTVSLDPTENLLDSDAVAALAADLAKVCRVKVIAPCAAVTLVGRGMRAMLHQLSAVLAEFGQMRVHLISQSSNNLNLTFVVDEGVVDDIVPYLHELLVRSGSLRGDDAELFGASWQMLYGSGEAPLVPAWWKAPVESERLLALAAERTPRYVYHLPTVRERACRLNTLKSIDRRWYAVKANTHPAVMQAVAAEGFGLECVSPGELEAAARVAPDAPRLFTPNFARRGDFATAFDVGAQVTVDALYPLEHWGELFAEREILLRVDLGRGLGHHEKVRTGGDGSKFGLPLDQLHAFLELASTHDVRVTGLHAHLGSGILDAAHWGEVAAQLAALAERIGSIEVLNIGGGLGVPTHPGEQPLDLDAMNAALQEVRRAYPHYQMWIEPGRYLIAEAGVLLARVTQLKHKGSQHYLGVDAGMHNLIRPALYDAWHEIANLTRLDEPPSVLYQVVGPICETGDVLGVDRRLPETRGGDVMLLAQAGAYGASMASHYNLRDDADEIVIE
ncbi:MAG TPA: bifunctional aspartate kinase/diaminopimelate decarboxylase [Oleiagrimonas sp.]|nr:bifunctional aspartate kinase/diaminopimelate decarboxylase [Oleiagrimonas sp.]